MNIFKAIAGPFTAALVILMAAGCHGHAPDNNYNENRKVLLFYECAFNDIGSYMKTNMDDPAKGLPAGYIPKKSEDVLLVYSRYSKNNSTYTPVESYLRRIYQNSKGKMISDTLKVFDSGTIASSPETMREVLSYVKDEFPAKGYGMVFSSHGSGWLPAGYYNNPSRFESEHGNEIETKAQKTSLAAAGPARAIPEGDLRDTDPFYGMVRSLGHDFIDSRNGYEMSISEFADGIPYRLDYILFDMCFTGGIEVAYGLKDKADYLGLSPAEVLGDGMYDYTKITSFLLASESPNLEGLFRDAFNMYDKQSGAYRSATVNLVRTDGLDNLAEVTARLIDEYADTLSKAPASDIQGYFRQGRHYFYDLVDIFAKCGVPESEVKTLLSAVDNCIIYKNATPSFLVNAFDITNYSGFSMYLPCNGTPLLDSYYKKEAWNTAVGLVK